MTDAQKSRVQNFATLYNEGQVSEDWVISKLTPEELDTFYAMLEEY